MSMGWFFSGSTPISPTLSTSARSAAFVPRALLTGVKRPSLSVCMTGLMPSIVPTSAAVELTRPPRFKWFRSSTMNQWHWLWMMERT